jgi:hypothetical protein
MMIIVVDLRLGLNYFAFFKNELHDASGKGTIKSILLLFFLVRGLKGVGKGYSWVDDLWVTLL